MLYVNSIHLNFMLEHFLIMIFYLIIANFMRDLPLQIYLLFTNTLWISCFYPRFTDKETKAQKGVLTCLKSHDWVIEPECEPKSVRSQSLYMHHAQARTM